MNNRIEWDTINLSEMEPGHRGYLCANDSIVELREHVEGRFLAHIAYYDEYETNEPLQQIVIDTDEIPAI